MGKFNLPKKYGYRYLLTLGAGIVLGLIFVISGVGKLLGQSAFLLSIESAAFVPPSVAIIIADWLPWVELILGACLIIGIATQLVALFSVVLIAAFVFHNSWMIGHGLRNEPCHCLGVFEQVFQGQLSTIGALYVDIGLFILALVIYFCYRGSFFDVRPWFLRRGRVASGPLPVGEKDGSGAVPGNQG